MDLVIIGTIIFVIIGVVVLVKSRGKEKSGVNRFLGWAYIIVPLGLLAVLSFYFIRTMQSI